jgi:hypothetical protein
MDNETLRILTKLEMQVKERLTTYTDTLTRGTIKDWAEYRHIVGKIDAFKQLLQLLHTLARGEDDDE